MQAGNCGAWAGKRAHRRRGATDGHPHDPAVLPAQQLARAGPQQGGAPANRRVTCQYVPFRGLTLRMVCLQLESAGIADGTVVQVLRDASRILASAEGRIPDDYRGLTWNDVRVRPCGCACPQVVSPRPDPLCSQGMPPPEVLQLVFDANPTMLADVRGTLAVLCARQPCPDLLPRLAQLQFSNPKLAEAFRTRDMDVRCAAPPAPHRVRLSPSPPPAERAGSHDARPAGPHRPGAGVQAAGREPGAQALVQGSVRATTLTLWGCGHSGGGWRRTRWTWRRSASWRS